MRGNLRFVKYKINSSPIVLYFEIYIHGVGCLGVLVHCVQRLAGIWNSYIGDHIIYIDSLAFPFLPRLFSALHFLKALLA